MGMSITITLQEADLMELWQVLLDEDEAGALAFLKDHILPLIPARGEGNCDSTRLNAYLLKRGHR